MGALTFSLEELPEAIDALDTLCRELRERVDTGRGVTPKGAPRILAMLPPHHTAPVQDNMVSEMGMAIVSTDRIFTTKDAGNLADPYEKMVWEIMQGSLFHGAQRRINLIIEGCKRLKVDGVLDRYHVGCRAVTGDTLLIKEAVTRELGIPVMLMERDDFDPRLFNPEQYRRNLEVFRTMLEKPQSVA
jgi:benzoyl-CoA reductase/2-hydroxyglutaryl-CoA dehydratase subunit BcrC/BadD/HgdB